MMSSEVIAILDDLCKRLGVAVDWTSENVLPNLETLTEKAVQYEFLTSVMWLCIGVVVIALSVAFARLGIKVAIKEKEKYGYSDLDSDTYLPFVCIAAMFCFVAIIVIIAQMEDIIACKVFPEKIIVDILKSLTRAKS